MAEQSDSAALNAAFALLRALASEVKNAAHDPALVHVAAQKLHHGIDMLEKVLTEQPPPQAEKK